MLEEKTVGRKKGSISTCQLTKNPSSLEAECAEEAGWEAKFVKLQNASHFYILKLRDIAAKAQCMLLLSHQSTNRSSLP